MSNRKFVVGSLVLAIGVISACSHRVPAECKELCTLPEEQQYLRFKSYPVEKQFELYVYCENEKTCMHDSESPHDYYANWMAQDDRASSYLVEKLKTEKDEDIQWGILYVLSAMSVNGHLKGRRDVAEVSAQTANNMKGSLINRLLGEKSPMVEQSKEWAREIEVNTR